jgi:hypothetical protein
VRTTVSSSTTITTGRILSAICASARVPAIAGSIASRNSLAHASIGSTPLAQARRVCAICARLTWSNSRASAWLSTTSTDPDASPLVGALDTLGHRSHSHALGDAETAFDDGSDQLVVAGPCTKPQSNARVVPVDQRLGADQGSGCEVAFGLI